MENKLKEGERLFAEGKVDEAERYFLSLINNGIHDKEVFNNLGVIAFQRNDRKKAVDYFTRSLDIDPFYKAAVLNYADLLNSLNQLQTAKPLLQKVGERYPDDDEITDLLKIFCSHDQSRTKIAVICAAGLETFLKDIVDFLKTRHEVKVCYTTNVQEIVSAIMCSDIVWLEWANELTIALTNHTKEILKDKHVICRLHSYEALVGFIQKIKWERINDLIFVAKHIRDISIKQIPELPQLVNNIHIIPNGVNMDKFKFNKRKKGWNIAYLGSINYKKGPLLLLHAFWELVRIDKRYQLFIGGKIEDGRYELYFDQMTQEMGLEENIHFDGWIENQNINTWFKDKQYIICTSILEGHPVGVMEAMASGLKPLIHNYVGARNSYPDKYIWNTIPEFITMATEEEYDSGEYREFIETNYSLEIQLQRIDKIITAAGKENTTQSQSVDLKQAELSAFT